MLHCAQLPAGVFGKGTHLGRVRGHALVAAIVVALALFPTAAAGATQPPQTPSGTSGIYGVIHPAGHSDLKHPSRVADHPPQNLPKLSPRHGDDPVPKVNLQPSNVPTTTTPATAGGPRAPSAPASYIYAITGISYEGQISWFGRDQTTAPPDTHIAVGVNRVVETTNSSMAVFDKNGSLQATGDLNQVFPVPAGYRVADPWVLYFGGTFYASGVAIDNQLNSQLYLATSAGEDPTSWTTFLVKQNTVHVGYDQPKLAVSSYTGITLAWSDFDCGTRGCPFLGDEIWVGVRSGPDMRFWLHGPDPSMYAAFPTQQPTGVSDAQFLVFNASDPDLFTVGSAPVLGVLWITGNPTGTVGLGTRLLPMTPTHIPPDAEQIFGGRPITTNDDRVVSAVLNNGSLWLATSDACTPAGDTVVRSCLRLIHVATNTFTIDQNLDLAQPYAYLYYPALTRGYINGSEYIYVVSNHSSLNYSPSILMNSFPSSNPSALQGEILLQGGTGAYDCTFCAPGNRWGDFSSAVVDGSASLSDIWFAGEYAASGTDRQNWGTAIRHLTFSAPTVTSISPAYGSNSGGTSVTVTGSNFISSNTTVNFGSVKATNVTVNSPTQLTVISPAQAPSGVPVTVTTPVGTTPSLNAPLFTYLYPPMITNVSPTSGSANVTSVTITGNDLGTNPQVLFGTLPSLSLSNISNTSITATPPPGQGGSVSIYVKTPGGTGMWSQFTYIATSPQVTGLSPTKGGSIGGDSIRIFGSGFNGTTSVQFGATPAASYVVESDTAVVAVSPPGSGTVDVTVTSGPNTSPVTTADRFTYISVTLTSISPTSGPPAGGTLVTLTGTGFLSNQGTGYIPGVLFGNTPTPANVISDTQATASSPAASAIGPVQVKICAAACSGTQTFTYAINVTSVTPSTGTTAGGTAVVLLGSGFNAVTGVQLGSVPAGWTRTSDQQLNVTTPPHVAGSLSISVSVASGPNPPFGSIATFTYVAPVPTVMSLSPARAVTWGGKVVIITGSGLSFATAATFGGAASQAFHVDSDTQITAVSPAHAPGLVDITVSTAGGTSGTGASDQIAYTDCAVPASSANLYNFGAPCTAVRERQYYLQGSDGSTWVGLNRFALNAVISPSVNSNAILTANADLWTMNDGYNQDIAILVNDKVVAWKESGGFAGTFSPNAAYVQAVVPMTANNAYLITLAIKTNKPAPGATIFVGAGPIGGNYSPTRLSAQLVPTNPVTLMSAVAPLQQALAYSDGSTWTPMNVGLVIPYTPTSNGFVVASANADLWTPYAGFNQDIGIAVSGGAGSANAYPSVSGQPEAWKESGGYGGTYSPNAAFVQTVVPVSSGQTYNFSVVWKANKPDQWLIFAGAGPIGAEYSPTSLTVLFIPASAAPQVIDATSSAQYQLTGSDGATWRDVDATNLSIANLRSASPCYAILSANADLWTSSAGYNQDLGIAVQGGGYPTVGGQPEGWKESGGFAGTYSPNAAFAQVVVSIALGTTYTAKLQWKSNKPDPGTIFIGAGPIGSRYSPTRLTAQLIGCT